MKAQNCHNIADFSTKNIENKNEVMKCSKNIKSEKKSLYSFTFDELSQIMNPSFRAKQIYDWIYNKYATDFKSMTNLNKNLIEELQNEFSISTLEVTKIETSTDGSKKYLFKTNDNLFFESVFMKMKDKKIQDDKVIKGEQFTFCLSSQIGCKVGCTFCLTAKGDFGRNLKVEEIVEQVVFLKRDNNLDSNKSINIVFMGMGEPLLNLNNVAKSIKITSSNLGLGISPKRHTISTSGIAPKIKELGELNLGINLALSLHATNDDLRTKLMPINKVYNLKSVMDCLKIFPLQKRDRILFEYMMIKNVNDSLQDAKMLVKLLHGFRAKVNLIPFNAHKGSDFERPEYERIKAFADFLYQKGITATIRYSKGLDISAACGQLYNKYNA